MLLASHTQSTPFLPRSKTPRDSRYLFNLAGGSALAPQLRRRPGERADNDPRKRLIPSFDHDNGDNGGGGGGPLRHTRSSSSPRPPPHAMDLDRLLGLGAPIHASDLDQGERRTKATPSRSSSTLSSPSETVINAPIPFERTSPEWKLAMISYLLKMRAHGLNIDLVDSGVRKKVGTCPQGSTRIIQHTHSLTVHVYDTASLERHAFTHRRTAAHCHTRHAFKRAITYETTNNFTYKNAYAHYESTLRCLHVESKFVHSSDGRLRKPEGSFTSVRCETFHKVDVINVHLLNFHRYGGWVSCP